MTSRNFSWTNTLRRFDSRTALLVILLGSVGCGHRQQAGNRGQTQDEIREVEQKIARFEQSRAANRQLLEKCQREKEAILTRLEGAGVKTGADLKDNPKGQQYAQELLRVQQEIEPLEQYDQKCEEAISQARSLIRRLERSLVQEEAGITDDGLADLGVAIRNLDDKQGVDPGPQPGDPLKLDALLQKELNRTSRKITNTSPSPSGPPRLDRNFAARMPGSSPGRLPKIILVNFSPMQITLQKGQTASIRLRVQYADQDVTLRLEMPKKVKAPAEVVMERGQEEAEIQVTAGDEAGVFTIRAVPVGVDAGPFPAECRVTVGGAGLPELPGR